MLSRAFEQGSKIRAGQVLYHIDPSHYEVELQAAEAALNKAVAVLEQETRNAQRMETLIATRAVSQAQYENAVAALNQSRADVAARRADVGEILCPA